MDDEFIKPELKIVAPIGGFHGISAILPKFEDIINYEEKKIILNRGYPRFVTHPFIKKVEYIYQKSFKAKAALCCQSYESAVFLIVDYYFKKGHKIFFDNGLPLEIFTFLNHKFPDLITKTGVLEADILIVNTSKSESDTELNAKVYIGLTGKKKFKPYEKKLKFDILIHHDKKDNIGVILFFNYSHLNLILLRRHCGFIASSRKICRTKNVSTEIKMKYEHKLRNLISKLELSNADECFLYPSGMAAIFTAFLSLLSSKKKRFIALGSLYVDTIRILEKWPKKYGLSETVFINNNIEKELEKHVDENTAGIIFEIPSNPLIQIIDVEKVISIAHSKNTKVIVDNTIATPYNFNPFKYNADIIVHSTTKFLNGKNNHIGGVVLSKDKKIIYNLKKFNNLTNLDMAYDDIKILTRNLKYFNERMKLINKNSEIVAEFLNNHRFIKQVYYPSLKTDPNFTLKQKYLKGCSGLISFILKDSSKENAEIFYNNINKPILKGPSLGSEKTLISPYVVMAHYNDSKEKLKELGFDFYLMRLSVGIEPVGQIINSIGHALDSLK